MMRRAVYGVALVRASGDSDQHGVRHWMATGTGSTTGFSLTPGLGWRGGFYIGFTSRR